MKEFVIIAFEYLTNFVTMAFADASIVALVAGTVFFLLGIVILTLAAFIRLTGRRVKGRVVGAVNDIRIEEKVRHDKREKEQKETLFAIFEYDRWDGSSRREKSSNGGNDVLKYKTGQSVNLIVCSHGDFDDVYDAGRYGEIVMGGLFLLVGFAIVWSSASFYASLGTGISTLLITLVLFVFKVLMGRKKKSKGSSVSKHPKEFDPSDVRPVEDFIELNNIRSHEG